MAQASKSTSGEFGAATRDEQLQELLSHGSDVRLLFGDEALPGHSHTLSMWSKVVGNALEASTCSSSSSSSSSGTARLLGRHSSSTVSIPMDGTSKDDWLTALSLIYPVLPQPDVTWENLEVSCKPHTLSGTTAPRAVTHGIVTVSDHCISVLFTLCNNSTAASICCQSSTHSSICQQFESTAVAQITPY
jgi:hypothetical protein